MTTWAVTVALTIASGSSAARADATNMVTRDGIAVITATFGTLGHRRTVDIGTRLQSLCGSNAQSCQVFCSETSFGRYRLGPKPICRVTYRCGPEFVRSVEAMREEPLLLRCPEYPVTAALPSFSGN